MHHGAGQAAGTSREGPGGGHDVPGTVEGVEHLDELRADLAALRADIDAFAVARAEEPDGLNGVRVAALMRTVTLLDAQLDALARGDHVTAPLVARAQIEAWLVCMHLALCGPDALSSVTAATAEAHLRNRNDIAETNRLVRRARKWLRSARSRARSHGDTASVDAVTSLLASMATATSHPCAPVGDVEGQPQPLNLARVRDAVAKELSRRHLARAGIRHSELRVTTVDFTAHAAYDRYRALCAATHANLDTLVAHLDDTAADPVEALTGAVAALDEARVAYAAVAAALGPAAEVAAVS